MTSELAALAAQIDALRQLLPRKRGRARDNRPILNCRLSVDEMAALDAMAMQNGLSRSDMVREIIGPVIGRVIATHKDIPHNFRHTANRRKPIHHTDPSTNDLERNKAIAREANQRAVQHGLLARQAALEAEAATAIPAPHMRQGMLSDSTIARSIPKLGR